MNIYIFVTPILQKKSCEYRRTIESGAVSGNWDTEWRVAVTLSLTLSLVISICWPPPTFQCFGRNFEIGCIYCRGINFWNQVQLLSNRRGKVFWETTDFSLTSCEICEMLGRPGSLFRVVLHFSVWACFVSCLRMIIAIQLDELVYSVQSAQWQFLFCTLWCNKKGFDSAQFLVEGSLMQWKSKEFLNPCPLHPLWHFLYHLPLHNCPLIHTLNSIKLTPLTQSISNIWLHFFGNCDISHMEIKAHSQSLYL